MILCLVTRIRTSLTREPAYLHLHSSSLPKTRQARICFPWLRQHRPPLCRYRHQVLLRHSRSKAAVATGKTRSCPCMETRHRRPTETLQGLILANRCSNNSSRQDSLDKCKEWAHLAITNNRSTSRASSINFNNRTRGAVTAVSEICSKRLGSFPQGPWEWDRPLVVDWADKWAAG